jgi:hypothetical protein
MRRNFHDFASRFTMMEPNVPRQGWCVRFTLIAHLEADMPIILWLLGVPAIVVVALLVTHVI